MRRPSLLGVSLLLVFAATAARADEGMWTFNGFPFERFEKAYGYRPSAQWLDHARLAALRFGNGGSAGFVSADGLVLTNHHVGAGCIQSLSTAERDLMRDGFVAATPADERPCPALELNLLERIERVTRRVQAAEKPDMSAAEAADARKAAMARLEDECSRGSGLRCDVVTLYSGGEYDLYEYRRLTDVRLVFAPEAQLAQFGGDDDNFEYPRYSVDFSLFRAYVDGHPYRPSAFLRVSTAGVREGEVTFEVGNPGSTGRLLTLAQLEWLRDVQYPFALDELAQARTLLYALAARGAEPARIAGEPIDRIENSIKAISGYQSGLLDPQLMARKAAAEEKLRAAVARDPALAARVGEAWSELERALATYRTFFARYQALDRGLFAYSQLAGHARTLLRLAAERPKPNGERLREYRETALPTVLEKLASTAPIHRQLEEHMLGAALRRATMQLGPVHPVTRAVLGEATPEQVAQAAIAGTRLADPAVRLALAEGGARALAAAHDPLVELMAALEPTWRALRERHDREVDAVEKAAGARVAAAWFAVAGNETYPDATFTLRISYAPVAGYAEPDGRAVPYLTRLGGYFDRAAAHAVQPPFDLPRGLVAAKERLDLAVPVDFLTTHDSIGGNSGSPILNRAGELVGVAFDSNLYKLPNRFAYTDERSRAIAVDARAILETLDRIYPAGHLARELREGRR